MNLVYSQPEFDVIVCAGYPSAELLASLSEYRGAHLVFVCPHPGLPTFLRKRLSKPIHYTVIRKLLAGTTDSIHYPIYNLPEWSGSQIPAGLNRFFPKLRKTSCIEVEGVTLDSLINTLKLSEDQNNSLILNTDSQISYIFKEIPDQLSKHFKWLSIRQTSAALYEGNESGCEYAKLLAEYSFQLSNEHKRPANHDLFSYLNFYFDPKQAQITKLSSELVEKNKEYNLLKQKRDALEEQCANLKQKLEAVSFDKNKQESHATKQLEQATKEKEQQTKLANERFEQLEQATKEKEQQTKLANERFEQLEQATKEKEQQTKLANERFEQLEQATKEKGELTKRQHAMQEEMGRAEAQLDLIKDIMFRELGIESGI